MSQAGRQYNRRFFIAMMGYVIAILVSQSLLNTMTGDVARYLVSIIPMFPVGYGLFAYLSFLRQLDELQRRIQLDGLGFSVAITGLITFTLGLLETAGLPMIGMVWVFPMLIGFWGLGTFIANRRYN